MKNRLLTEELKRMGGLMTYNPSKTLTEQKKVINSIIDDVVDPITKWWGKTFDGEYGWLVDIDDAGVEKLRISNLLDEMGESISPRMLEFEELVNGNSWDSFNTGFNSLNDFMDDMIVGNTSSDYKRALMKIFYSDVEDVPKNAKKIIGDKNIMSDLIDEVEISLNKDSVDDISEFLFDVKFKDLKLPGHTLLVKNVNRSVKKQIKTLANKAELAAKKLSSKPAAWASFKTRTYKLAKLFFTVLTASYAVESIFSFFSDKNLNLLDGVGEGTDAELVTNAFKTSYWMEMTRDWPPIEQNKQLLNTDELKEIYTKMKLQLDNFDNDPIATAGFYDVDGDIKSILQASQFTDYYNLAGTGNNLLKDMAEAMSIKYAKGGINTMIKDFLDDENISFVFDQIKGLDITVGADSKTKLTDEEVQSRVFSSLPEYPTMMETGEGNSYQKWCSTMVPGQTISIVYYQLLVDYCGEENTGVGCEATAWVDKLKGIPVGVQNSIHKTALGEACFEVATGEDEDGWPMCTGELARHTLEFDGTEFKKIVNQNINALKNDDEE